MRFIKVYIFLFHFLELLEGVFFFIIQFSLLPVSLIS